MIWSTHTSLFGLSALEKARASSAQVFVDILLQEKNKKICFNKNLLYFCEKIQIMQQSTSLEAKKLDLMQMIMSIETSIALDKVAKYITQFLPKSVPQELSEDTISMI